MKWFRVYHEDRTDPKLDALSDAEHRVWFRLMCFASEQVERGRFVGYDEDLLAVEVARGDSELLRATLAKLHRLRVIDAGDDGVTVINWDKRQYDKPSDSASQTRDRKQRSRQRHANVTRETTTTNDVTPMSRDVTRCHATDTDTESDTESDTDTEAEAEAEKTLPRAVAREVVVDTPFAVLSEFLEEIGSDEGSVAPAWKSKQLAIAKRLLEQGYGAATVRRCVAFMRSQSWRTDPFDLGGVERYIGTWEASGKPERELPRPPPRAAPRRRHEPDFSGIDEFDELLRQRGVP